MEDLPWQLEKLKNLQQRFGIDKDIFYYPASAENLCRIYTPIKQDFFVLLFFESGNGVHIIENEKYEINGMQVHILFPDQQHRWDFDDTILVHQLFVSRKVCEYLSPFMKFPKSVYKKNPVIRLTPEVFFQIVHECKDIEYVLKNGYIMNDNMIYTKVKIILQEIDREIQTVFNEMEPFRKHPVLFNFKLLVDKTYKSERKVKWYAGKLGVTANYLNVLCKKYLNRTATDIILEEVIQNVKKHLMSSGSQFTDIAFEFGFQDYASFSKCIKKNLGASPKYLRQNKA